MGKVGSGSGRDVNVGEEKGADGDEEHGEDDDDGKEEAGSGKGAGRNIVCKPGFKGAKLHRAGCSKHSKDFFVS